MSEERCERSDLPVSMCGHCRGHTGTEQFEFVVTRTMVAKYGGSCNACGSGIVAGVTTIGLTEDDETGWVCEGCFK